MGEASPLRRTHGRAALSVLLLTGLLAGCVEQFPEVQVSSGDIRNAIARGQLTSPRAATVALVSLEGAPPEIEARFRQAFSAEAAAREIAITDAASAHYLLRGYLSAYPDEQGVTIAYTYDVFDSAAKDRRQRVANTIAVPDSGGDPWSAVNDAVLASLVANSADDLAVSLGGTPEAQTAAGKVAATIPDTAAPVN